MTQVFAPVHFDPGPAPKPIRGLFSVAEVHNVDARVSMGAEYQTNLCNAGNLWAEWCSSETKIFNQLFNVVGTAFAVYDAIDCEAVGMDSKELDDALRDSFDSKAEAITEAELQKILQSQGVKAAITPADSLLAAVMALEGILAGAYAGRGLLHFDRPTAIAAHSQRLFENPDTNDSPVQTINGTRAVLGRGYLGSPGNYWVGATGRVIVLRGPASMIQTYPTSDEPPKMLIEQQVLLLIECLNEWSEVPTA